MPFSRLFTKWATLTAALLASTQTFALEVPESFHAVRPMGMGGAFTAVANDENAVWSNPAGISRIRKHRSRSAVSLFKFPNVIAGINTSGSDFYDSVTSVDEAEIATSISANADKLADKPFWAMAAAFPMIMFDFSRQLASVIGGYSHTTLKATVDQDTPLEAQTEVISDVGGVLSFAATNWTNRFSVGFQVRPVSRYAFEDTVDTTVMADPTLFQDALKEGANKSQAVAVDAGVLFTLADYWFPTIGISVMNAPTGCQTDYLNPFSQKRETVCGTVFSGDFANPQAVSTIDPTDIRMGVSILPRLTRKIALRLSVGIHQYHVASGDLNYGLSEIPIQKRIHGGLELVTGNPLLPSPISLSVGMSQGYYTMGASIRLSILSLDFASFGRDISTTDTPYEDRRVMGGFSLDF